MALGSLGWAFEVGRRETLSLPPPTGTIEHFEDGEKLFAEIVKWELEGIAAKRADARYVAGRPRDWVKVRAPGARPQTRS